MAVKSIDVTARMFAPLANFTESSDNFIDLLEISKDSLLILSAETLFIILFANK